MPIKASNLDGIVSWSDLATALCVPESAVDNVSLGTTACRRSGCSLSVGKHNNGYCVLHSHLWFPRELDKFGRPAAKRRGYGLDGPQFLIGYRGTGITKTDNVRLFFQRDLPGTLNLLARLINPLKYLHEGSACPLMPVKVALECLMLYGSP